MSATQQDLHALTAEGETRRVVVKVTANAIIRETWECDVPVTLDEEETRDYVDDLLSRGQLDGPTEADETVGDESDREIESIEDAPEPEPTHTPNGYDPRWLPVINAVLEDRGADVRVHDLDDAVWSKYIGPMCDAIEDGELPWLVRRG